MTFEYNDGGSILPEGAFRISPSQVSKFFTNPSQWYREQVLGEEGFKGNTASELGTIVHNIAEAYANGEVVDVAVIERHIKSLQRKEDVDTDIISNNWKPMAMALVNTYLKNNMPTECEEFLYHEQDHGYFPSGSCDGMICTDEKSNGIIIDYKTTSSLSPPTSIPFNYKLQLLMYAWLYEKRGVSIDRIRIVYVTRNTVGRVSEKTNKPMKDYPSTVGVVTESITEDDLQMIENKIKLIIETMQTLGENPSLAYLLFKDYSLKLDKDKPKEERTDMLPFFQTKTKGL